MIYEASFAVCIIFRMHCIICQLFFYKVGAWNLLVEADMIEVGKGHSYKHMDMQGTEGYESGAGK